jgi:hypothetical protein
MAKTARKVLVVQKDQPDHRGRKVQSAQKARVVRMVIRGKMENQDTPLKKEKTILQKTIKKSLLEMFLMPFLFGKEANING